MVEIEKCINGEMYKTVPAVELGLCEGCAFDEDGDGCDAAGHQCVVSGDIIWAKRGD